MKKIFFVLFLIFVFFIFYFKNKEIKKDLGFKTFPFFSSHSLAPMASNQWYSNIYKAFPTQPIFAMPLVFKLSQDGLSFSYPSINKTPDTVFASFTPDFTIGTNSIFEKPIITSLGDWDIHLKMRAQNGDLISFFLAHGAPDTIIHAKTKNLSISFTDNVKIVSLKNMPANSFVVAIKNQNYIFVLPSKFTPIIKNNKIDLGNVNYVFIALLDNLNHANLFLKQATNDLISTKSDFSISNEKLNVFYKFKTTNGAFLTSLYPDQYDFLPNSLKIIGDYNSIRGKLKLVEISSFETQAPLILPESTFPKLNKTHSDLVEQLNQDAFNLIKNGPPGSKDYFLGTWFGKATTLIQLSDTLGENETKTKLLNYVTPIFINSLANFYYDKNKTSLIAKLPEFGNENLNDHNFHYGYYIRTAAVLSSFEPSIIPQIKTTVNEMALDIANYNRQSNKYPYLRGFDIYESHSWADGFANFADGNNQESSSEAINAWYGVYLWGKIINDQQIENTSLYLYNQEILGAKYYWFDIKHRDTLPYQHVIGSIIWGGKVDYATWFSGLTNMIYGIQLLPFTPGSLYLGTLPHFTKYQNDYFQHGGDIQQSWGDLFLMWESFYNPQKALSEKDKVVKLEADNPKSLFLYFIYYNASLIRK